VPLEDIIKKLPWWIVLYSHDMFLPINYDK